MNTKEYIIILIIVLISMFTAYKFEIFTFEEITLYWLAVIAISTFDKK